MVIQYNVNHTLGAGSPHGQSLNKFLVITIEMQINDQRNEINKIRFTHFIVFLKDSDCVAWLNVKSQTRGSKLSKITTRRQRYAWVNKQFRQK